MSIAWLLSGLLSLDQGCSLIWIVHRYLANATKNANQESPGSESSHNPHDYDSHLFNNHGWVEGASTKFSTQKLWSDECTIQKRKKPIFHQSQRQLAEVNSVFPIVPELPHNLNVLIIIHTIPLEHERRNILRQTWARQSSWTLEYKSCFPDSGDIVDIGYFFMMGFHGNPCIDQSVEAKSQIHRKIFFLWIWQRVIVAW